MSNASGGLCEVGISGRCQISRAYFLSVPHNPTSMNNGTAKRRKLAYDVDQESAKGSTARQRKLDDHSLDGDESVAKSHFAKDRSVDQLRKVEELSADEEESQEEEGEEAEDDDTGAEIEDDDEETEPTDDTSEDDEISQLGNESKPEGKKRKAEDPEAFANSISNILRSKLTTSQRADPVLARNKEALKASKEITDARLEARAKSKLREEKKAALEKGRVKDVLGLQSTDTSTAGIMEEEKRLKKTAQRGVVKLFNAVRAAQIKGEEAAKDARKGGVVGINSRQERVNEMSKTGFLELIAAGGSKPSAPHEAT